MPFGIFRRTQLSQNQSILSLLAVRTIQVAISIAVNPHPPPPPHYMDSCTRCKYSSPSLPIRCPPQLRSFAFFSLPKMHSHKLVGGLQVGIKSIGQSDVESAGFAHEDFFNSIRHPRYPTQMKYMVYFSPVPM